MMEQALVEAKKGWPSPNPHVGVVIAKEGAILARGHHERAGDDHAEVAALKAAGAAARGATLYATLEPCNHHGRTPPCTDAILAAGVARVVIGCADPNPHVEGGGATRLEVAGVKVTLGVLEEQASQIIRAFKKHVTSGMPYVSVKLALSLDGRIATRTGASRWVTGPVARAKVHALRGEHDGVAVGIGTALADDPRLTVRDAPGRNPLRIVFDTRLRLPLSSRLVTTAATHPVCVLCTDVAAPEPEEALVARGVHVVRTARSADGRVDVAAGLTELAKLGVVRLMVEGGAELAGSFLASQLADELHAFLAPLLLGPRGRPGAVDWAGPATLGEAPRIESPRWELVGEDAYVHGRIAYPT
jgi:diaminohydroxyphosphoribosylaminopyrimidine deaminase/5-amino-6-(5-phosphoribosylamino)uracil reductase